MSNCARCRKFVALPEERRACSKVYHIDCFLCGGSNSDGCGKKMALTDYTDKNGQPYCKVCYGRLFGPKGFIGGTANFNSYDDTRVGSASEAPAPAPAAAAPRPPPPKVPAPPRISAPVPAAESVAATPSPPASGRLVNDRNKPAIASEVLPGKGVVSSARSNFNPGVVNGCAKCGRAVTLAEERKACKATWHIDCFVCGGRQSDGCKKKLTLQDYTSHDDDPYCRTCYNRLFGPKGFIGGSATINTFEDQRGVTVKSTTPAPAPAAPPKPAAPPRAAPKPAPPVAAKTNSGRLVNDRNAPAISGEILPQSGSVRAAMQNLKKELPHA